MTFNGLITTARPPQWPGGPRPEAAPEPGDRAPRTKERGVSPLSGGRRPRRHGRGRGSGNGQDSDSRARRQRGGSGPREENRAARRNPGATAAPFARDQPALAGRGPGCSTETRCPNPTGATGAGSVRRRRGQWRGTRAVTHCPGKPRAPEGAILEPSCAAPTPARPEDAECRHPPPPGPIPSSTGPAQGRPLTLPSKLFSSTSLMLAESWPRGWGEQGTLVPISSNNTHGHCYRRRYRYCRYYRHHYYHHLPPAPPAPPQNGAAAAAPSAPGTALGGGAAPASHKGGDERCGDTRRACALLPLRERAGCPPASPALPGVRVLLRNVEYVNKYP